MTIENTTEGRGYQLPAPSNRLSEDVLRLIAALGQVDDDVVALFTALADKASAGHAHAIADITGLVSALAGKAATGHTHALSSLTDTSIASPATGQVLRRSGSAWANATLTVADITNLAAAITTLTNADSSLTSSISALTARVDTIDGGTY